MDKYNISVVRTSFDGNDTLVVTATGISEKTIETILNIYNSPCYKIVIGEEIEKGSEQQRWLEGK